MSILEKKFLGGSLKDKFLFIALAIMALGQWADTKQVIEDGYVAIVSNFTHHYEYQKLNNVNIGSNIDYIAQIFGAPQLIKKSKYQDNVSFSYFLNDNYILTLIIKEKRVTAYTITALAVDFTPNGLLDKRPALNKISVADYANNMVDFTLDNKNVDFFLVREQADKNKLFINQYFGAVDYKKDTNLSTSELKNLYQQVNLDEENEAIKTQVIALSSKARNDFYGVGEISLSIIADSVLTNFEYSFYYKNDMNK